MLRAGDELSHSQGGNNHAYCQDNQISWLDWQLLKHDPAFLDFVRRIINLRRDHPIFRRRKFFEGRPIHGDDIKDLAWLNPDGREMTDEEWDQHFARCLGVYLSGAELDEMDERGNPLRDDDFIVLINAHHEAIPFLLPDYGRQDNWFCLMDTAYENGLGTDGRFAVSTEYPLQGRSLVLLMRPRLRRTA
jgi:glycogen operon protein